MVKIDLYCLRQKCSPKNLRFNDISFIAIFAEVIENECVIKRLLRDIDAFAIPVLLTCPIWLRAQVSKQISCSAISVVISPQRIITVLENRSSCTNPVRRFQFNNQLFAPNRTVDEFDV